jgi:VWFA-related protein
MTRFAIAVATLAIGTVALPAQQPPAPLFKAGVDAVKVDALVTRRGHPVGGLTAADFELLDNGVPQTVASVALESVPVNVVLILDVSGSVAGERLAALANAGRAAIEALRPIDRAAVATFSNEIEWRTPMTTDRSSLLADLDHLVAAGGTSLYDAAYAGMLLSVAGGSRTLCLIFSDGRDTSSWLPASSVLDMASRSDAVVYGVATEHHERPVDRVMANPDRRSSPWGTARVAPVNAFLEQIAAATGGRVLQADDHDLPSSFANIVKEFQNRYLLMFTPSQDAPGWHAVEVRVKGHVADVQARRGYWK